VEQAVVSAREGQGQQAGMSAEQAGMSAEQTDMEKNNEKEEGSQAS
jgi:hypothetical protein